MKRGICISDLHCGHLVGLTPPNWQSSGEGWRKKIRETQKQAWNWFDNEMSKLSALDFIICNGDAIDGDGRKSGGSELLTTDTNVQAEIASFILKRYMTRKTKLYMTYGTAYHTGSTSDTEALIAHDCNAQEIGGHLFLDIEGVKFDIKHKVGSAVLPHSRATATKKAALLNKIWAEAGEQPSCDVYIRSHVHYHQYSGDPDLGLCMTTPALQAFGSKYGARECEGRVHFGFINVECDKGEITWKANIAKLAIHKSKLSKV